MIFCVSGFVFHTILRLIHNWEVDRFLHDSLLPIDLPLGFL